MTIFCTHCHRPLQAEMSCLPRRGKQGPGPSKPFRSTKSASKARRDQINAEVQALRSLLPISAQEKERLSYLHTMALVCLWLRGAQLFPPGTHGTALPVGPALGAELLSLLPGFLLVLLANGKLAYISENVDQVLGLSVVELLAQGDMVFDILDGRVHEEVHKKLLLAQEEPGREVTFVSEMRTSKAFRLQHGGNRAVAVCGRFMALRWPASPSSTAFLALCTPVTRLPADSNTSSPDDLFQSTHILDMTFTNVTESVTYHLGYHREELIGQSWYSLLHPEDADLAAAQHRAVAQGAEAGPAVLRVLRADRTWAWLRVAARRDGGGRFITCTSRCLRREEAAYLRARHPARRPAAPIAPPGRELSLLAAQLRALADSLSPPSAATAQACAWPETAAFPPAPLPAGPPQ
ncbi:neuronal PAS domain-containing protein 4 [Falco peregrinus]|uniref:neuronal PAS domain-containing protein 4 n=1 Tax=Falco peregrinus TaxID=8954 RepID=UPI00247A6BCA|nr:neuronal PAS domain-containing protein 4 [Falco peregrinus]